MNPLSIRDILGSLFGIVEIATVALLTFAVRRGVRVVARAQAEPMNYRRGKQLS
jgi:hypothetical protein